MKKPLRILVAHAVRCDRPGGMNRIMRLIHDRVARAGHAVEYLCAEHAPEESSGMMARFRFPLLVRRRVIAAARAGTPYDIVNVHEPQSAAVAVLPGGFPTRVAVTSHGLELRAWELALEERRLGREGPSAKSRLFYPLTTLWQCNLGLRRADHVFCLNNEDRDALTGRLGIPASRITRMTPGADPVFAEAARHRDYSRASRILFAGTWRKNKGIEDLVPAFAMLCAAHPGIELMVAGGGVPVETVRSYFPAAIRDRVQCASTASESDTAEVYASADLYLLPSLFEGTPLTLIEAMMSGLPIVTTATCGMKDVIEQERTGLLVPTRSPGAIAEAVTRLLAQAAERQRLGRAAQAEARDRYTWDRVAEPVLAAYERLAGSS